MPQPLKFKAVLAAAGLAGLASAMPLSASNANDLMRLDAGQLDAVSAGAITRLGLSGTSESFGTVNSFTSSTLRLNSVSSPFSSVSSGSQVNVAVGVGGVETPPTAVTTAQIDSIDGQQLFIIPIVLVGGGPGFQYSVNAVAAAAVSSEFPIF